MQLAQAYRVGEVAGWQRPGAHSLFVGVGWAWVWRVSCHLLGCCWLGRLGLLPASPHPRCRLLLLCRRRGLQGQDCPVCKRHGGEAQQENAEHRAGAPLPSWQRGGLAGRGGRGFNIPLVFLILFCSWRVLAGDRCLLSAGVPGRALVQQLWPGAGVAGHAVQCAKSLRALPCCATCCCRASRRLRRRCHLGAAAGRTLSRTCCLVPVQASWLCTFSRARICAAWFLVIVLLLERFTVCYMLPSACFKPTYQNPEARLLYSLYLYGIWYTIND
jgi:hypothetical protein